MLFRKSLVYIALVFCSVVASLKTTAQPFSYVYIQGDKETPFYVKLEDQMQPRYGKNYCIISQLATGVINVQILFQQNVYPPQKFTILVPDNGYRGFMLVKKSGAFALYDLLQNFYLPAGNSADDDHAPGINPANVSAANNYVATTKPAEDNAPANTVSTNGDNNTTISVSVEQPAQTQDQAQADNAVATATKPNTPDQPKFIDNIELDNERTVQPANTYQSTNEDLANDRSANIRPSLINSDCPNPMSGEEFQALYKRAKEKSDKTRLKYLLDKTDQCFTTLQVRILTKTLINDPERYAFLKQVYSRVTDQANYKSLESLLSTQEWKSYFRLIMP